MRAEHSALRPGARVALVSTSSPAPAELIDRAVVLLEAWGLVPVLGSYARTRHPRLAHLAGTDGQRAADLQQAYCDPGIDAIFCIRGGYGAARMLDHLDVDALRIARPKPVFGSSDVTAVAEFWRERLGRGFWFTPMIATVSLQDDPVATAGLRAAVFEPASLHTCTSAAATSIVPGVATGTLIGGNLSILAMTLAARSRPPLNHHGSLALIEDITESAYRIDGHLTGLLRAGWFDGVAGIGLGSWVDCGPLEDIHAVIEDRLGPLGVPIVGELGFGHGPGAHSIPLAETATLFADHAPRLQVVDTITAADGAERSAS